MLVGSSICYQLPQADSEHSHREIRVDSYDVTIFPAESIKNSVSKKAKMRSEAEEDDKYSAWFFDLAGEEQNRFTPLVKETISLR
jgi:hypothetical protein